MASVTFSTTIGGDGSTITDDTDPFTGLDGGGHRARFVPALEQMVAVAEHIVGTADTVNQESAVAVEAAAAAAAAAASAEGDRIATAADRVQTGLDAAATAADRVATGLDAAATAADRVATGLDAAATGADRVQTGLDAAATGADRIQTGQDAQATAADRTQTGLDRQATAADRIATGQDRVQTGQDRTATGADRLQTGLDAQATAADRIATGQDRQATAADRIATGQDRQATAADRIATGQDAAATDADRTQTELDRAQTLLDRQATAADRLQTGLDRTATGQDRTATGADRLQTGLDRIATGQDRVQTGQDAAAASQSAADALLSEQAAAASAALVGPPVLPEFVRSVAQAPGVVVESAAVTVSGSASAVWPAVVRGDGTPEVQINAGPWAQSAIFRAGDTVKLRNASPPVGMNYVATIYAASFSSNWVLGFDPSLLFAAGEQGVWYDPSDMSTMFQDAAGTTPVTAVEQPVGLILDKSKGLVLGPELVTAPVSVSGSYTSPAAGTVIRNGAGGTAILAIGVAGKTYRVTLTVSGQTGDSNFIRVAGGLDVQINGNGDYTFTILSVTSGGISINPWTGSAGAATFDNISVRELPGNHATQPTATSRPVLSARVNLLTKTEDFGDAVWEATGDGAYTVSKTATAPNGTPNDAFVITFTAGTFSGFAQNLGGVWPSPTVALCRIYMRSPLRNMAVKLGCQGSDPVGSLTCNLTATWQEFTVPAADVSGKLRYGLICNETFIAGDVVEVWHPQAETGSTATPYQRVNTATDYDADPAKFPKRLNFDNLDDAHNIAFPSALGSNCTVARAIPGVGAQILTGQTIGTSFSNTVTHAGMVIVDRAITVSESNNLTTYLNEKAGV